MTRLSVWKSEGPDDRVLVFWDERSLAMSDLYDNCTEECERPATCTVCKRRKSPLGRSVPTEMAGYQCDDDCPGYRLGDSPPHLWPGELARIRQDEAEQADRAGESESDGWSPGEVLP